MQINQNWVLNPDYRFKADLDRICMYSGEKTEYDSTPDWESYIHPYQAAILMLFDGSREAVEVLGEISTHFGITHDCALKLIEPYMGNETPVYTEWGGNKVSFPKNVLIRKEKINGDLPYRSFPDFDFDMNNVNLDNDRAHRAPHSMMWMLTSRCVTNCAYCYADKKTPYNPLTTERSLEIIDDAHRLGMKFINVIGGEVFLRKDWEVLIKRIIDYGMMPAFISTKMPVSEEILQKLVSTGYSNVIQISLDSLDEDILASTINVKKGYLSDLMEGVRRLDAAGFEIQIDTILTKDTATKEGLDALAVFLSTIRHFKYWEIRVPEFTPYSSDGFRKVMASRTQIREIESYVRNELMERFGRKIIFSAEPMNERFGCTGPEEPCFSGGQCGFLRSQMFVLPDGKVSACEQLYWHPEFIIGDLAKNSIEEVWQSSRALKVFNYSRDMYREGSQCVKCKVFDVCNTQKRRCVVKVIKAYGVRNWDYPDPRCVYAPDFKETLKY